MRCVVAWALLLAVAAARGAAGQNARAGSGDLLCFNQLQVLGTHNSYHQAPLPELLEALGGLASGPLAVWQYSQASLTQQLEAGVRSFELDVYWDPQGGLYGQAAGLRIANQSGYLADSKYQLPGFKVLHVPDFDYRTSCVLLADCLAEIAAWSAVHPRHLPIQLHVEVKEGGQVQNTLGPLLTGLLLELLNSSTANGPPGLVAGPDPAPQLFKDLQGELQAAFGGAAADGGSLLAPDDVRWAAGADAGADLQQLLLVPAGSGPCPWPSLDSMRGKVLVKLILSGGSPLAAALQEAYPDLRGSLAWVEQNGRQPLPQAAFRAVATRALRDDGTALTLALPANASGMVADMVQSLRDALSQGYIVRARSDADTVEARTDFTERRDAVLSAGAQVVATDYPALPLNMTAYSSNGSSGGSGTAASVPQPSFNTTYAVSLPGGQAGRCLLASVTAGGMTVSTGSSTANDSSSTLAAPSSNATAGSGGQGIAMYAAPVGGEDGIYCGPLDTVPPDTQAPAPVEMPDVSSAAVCKRACVAAVYGAAAAALAAAVLA